MADHKYETWHDVPKTKQNLYSVLFGCSYVEHDGRLYEFLHSDDGGRGCEYLVFSDINNGDPLFTSWYEILHSPAFSIKRKEVNHA